MWTLVNKMHRQTNTKKVLVRMCTAMDLIDMHDYIMNGFFF